MSMNQTLLRTLALSGLLAAIPQQAAAQEDAASGRLDAFFNDTANAEGGTEVHGSLTSTTFIYREQGNDSSVPLDDLSPTGRLFTDLRAQLTAKSIGGSSLAVRADARVRITQPCTFLGSKNPNTQNPDQFSEFQDCQTQSGTFGGNEYEVRELYARGGGKLGWQVGRQFVPEVAALKVDGARIQFKKSDNWQFLGFGGLHPSRISRSVVDDYKGVTTTLPGIAGAAGAYRYGSVYGAIGAAGILPGQTDQATNAAETVRTLATSNGYWRPSSLVDLYHFAVVDFTGAAGAGLTNLSLGVNLRPAANLRVTAAVNHIDTETLNVIAQGRLEDPDNSPLLQNNIEVSRISSDSARLGVSAALKERRFEVSTHFQIRRRPDIVLCPANMGNCTPVDNMPQTGILFKAAQAGEVMLSLVDRRSLGGFRLGASVINIFGIGDEVFRRSKSTIARLDGSRSFQDERVQLEADVSYVHSEDAGGAAVCNSPLTCFGNTTSNTIGGSVTVYYRLLSDLFVLGSANAGLQDYKTTSATTDAMGGVTGSSVLLSGFLRAAYRF